MLFFPEVKVSAIVSSIFNFLRVDFAENISGTDESKTYLYNLFNNKEGIPLKSRDFDYYKQAKVIFLAKENSERVISVYPIFNRSKIDLPSVHIFSSQENNENNSIGFSSFNPNPNNIGIGYNLSLQILVTSSNILEVQIIHYALRALLFSSMVTFEYYGIQNPKLSNQDIILKSEEVPDNIYSKGINFSGYYEENFNLLLKPLIEFIIKDIKFIGITKI